MREVIIKASIWLSEGLDAIDVVEKVINIIEGNKFCIGVLLSLDF